MKLPKRGVACRSDGTVYWAWEQQTPGDFDSMPPFVTNLDGTSQPKSASDDTIIDLDDCGLSAFDMTDLFGSLKDTRIRQQPDKSYVMTKVMDDGTEVDHPFLSILNFRRARRGLQPLKGVDVTVK